MWHQAKDSVDTPVRYKVKVKVDNVINLVIEISQDHLWHMGNGTMYSIHNVFVKDVDDTIVPKN